MQCPGCQQHVVPAPVGFTWWGGLIGAKLLAHVECPMCRRRFNGRTGQSNDTAILIYILFFAIVVGGLMIMLFRTM